MTAAELEEVFGEVRQSASWDDIGAYHFPRRPIGAEAFVVSPDLPSAVTAVAVAGAHVRSAVAEPGGAISTSISYPFPLRPGNVIMLELPADLSAREAERIATFLKSIALEAPAD
jgi:hypothetical protein